MTLRNAALIAFLASAVLCMSSGCAYMSNQWVEDGPAAGADLESPTAKDIRAKYSPAEQRVRDWGTLNLPADRGAVKHGPLRFEDPFVDKGHGREGSNKYHIGWEDYIALPYCYARFTLNWLMLPASAVVNPPWVVMESDGVLSKQALGYDHDACRSGAESTSADEPLPEDSTAIEEETAV